MGIQKITQLATNALIKVKQLPLQRAGIAGLIFTAGLVTGSLLLGDCFEKKSNNESTENMQNNPATNTELEIETTQPEVQTPEEEPFKYTRPIAGQNGCTAVDTTYYHDNGSVATITSEFELERKNDFFDKNGNYTGSHIRLGNGPIIKCIDSNGQYDGYDTPEGHIDAIDNVSYGEEDTTLDYHKEDDDGYIDFSQTYRRTYDNNTHRLKNEKIFDDTGLLKATITPKYNKDGDLIKRDTVWINR